MKSKKFYALSIFNARSVSMVSVALVLLILGIVALSGIAARNLTRTIKENLGFDIVLAEDASDQTVGRILAQIQSGGYARSAEIFTAEDAMARWKEETGEDVIEILGVNPFATEIDVKIVAEKAHRDSIEAIARHFRSIAGVEEVTVHSDMIDSINRNLKTTTMVLSIIAFAMLLISMVLINNTIRLSIYSRRFTIHTMKLVGATASYIRRPFVIQNAIAGAVAGLIASAILAALTFYAHSADVAASNIVGWNDIAVICSLMVVAGAILCALCAIFSTNRYLRLGYDKLFEK